MIKRVLLSIPFLLLLAACGGLPGAPTPQEAVLQEMEQQHTRPGEGQLVAGSLRVRQTAQVEQAVYVMVTYQHLIDNRQEDCQMTYLTSSRWGRWMMRGGGGGCQGVVSGTDPIETPALTVSGGTTSGSNLGSFSEVDGLVALPEIQQVRVTWEDGLVQTAPVVDQTYLIGRTGEQLYQRVEGLSLDGAILYTTEAVAAPTKEE